MEQNELIKVATESYAFGVSAALRDLGMPQEEAVEFAVKEAKASAAKGLLSRLKGHAKGVGDKAKEISGKVTQKLKGAGQFAKEHPKGTALTGAGIGAAATGTVVGGNYLGDKANEAIDKKYPPKK